MILAERRLFHNLHLLLYTHPCNVLLYVSFKEAKLDFELPMPHSYLYGKFICYYAICLACLAM